MAALEACAGAGALPHPTLPVPQALEAYADTLFREYASWESPGASVVVLSHGTVLLRKGYGIADLEQKQEARASTNYRLASLTKQFTATAILLLAQDGKLNVDDSIEKFLAPLPPSLRGITIRHLLTHTSGLLDYEDLIPEKQTEQVHDADVLALLRTRDSTLFVPGERFAYSNSGYAFLALIAERVSGERFGDLLASRIFVPVGMSRTVAFEAGRSAVEERAYGYSRTAAGSAGWERTDQSVTSAVLGDGGIYSSVDDLSRWALAVDRGTLLRKELLAMAFTPARLNDGSETDYGFGWFVRPYRGLFSTHHTGETRGFRNAIRRLPSEEITVIVLTNRDESEPLTLVDKLTDWLLDRR
jgi:CubicO group peptidase (beta-lactamase class C family)